jgi:hypothetical protein
MLEGFKKILPIEDCKVKELRAMKTYSLRQPVYAACLVSLKDEQFSNFALRYFPEDWKWGEPHKLLRGKMFLSELTIKNPLPSLTKAPFFGGAGIYTIQGNEEVKVKTGFMSSRITGYRFRSLGRNKENKLIVEKINLDQNLLNILNSEFSTGKGRPLPDFRYVDATILPLGGFDIFDIDGQKEKISDADFWKPDDPNTVKRIFHRIEILRSLAIYLQGKTLKKIQVTGAEHCSNCGTRLDEGNKYCSNCGKVVSH